MTHIERIQGNLGRAMRRPIERSALSVPEVAESMGLSERKVWALIANDELRAIRIGRRTLVPIASVRAILDPGCSVMNSEGECE
jgi:excisionase family DNA binding protein